MQLEIIDLNSEGEGVSTFQGKTIFVDQALEGETVIATSILQKKNYELAETLEVVKASPLRQVPPCPYFGSCGGCQLMHLEMRGQLEYKTKRVQKSIKKIAQLNLEVENCISSPEIYGYRNKIQLPVGEGVGLYRKRSHEIIPIERCLIQKNIGEEILIWIKTHSYEDVRYILIRTSDFEQKALVVFITSGNRNITSLAKKILTHPKVKGVLEVINKRTDSVILTDHVHLLCGESLLEEKILEKSFFFGALSFFSSKSQAS